MNFNKFIFLILFNFNPIVLFSQESEIFDLAYHIDPKVIQEDNAILDNAIHNDDEFQKKFAANEISIETPIEVEGQPKLFLQKIDIETWLLTSLQKDLGLSAKFSLALFKNKKINLYFKPSLEILNDYANNKSISPEISTGLNWKFLFLGLTSKHFKNYQRPHIGIESGIKINFKNSPWGIISSISLYRPTVGNGIDLIGLPYVRIGIKYQIIKRKN